ncbi:MAG: cobalamin B12-binding domain-containing protein [Nitrospirae bacterium]|nr:cobalamin B12-binding domain-containing protein [Nitrospirota bacterium]
MTNQKQLDLLLVNPGSRKQTYQLLGETLAAIEPPIWAGLIATFIRNHGFSVQILDAEAEDLTPEQAAQRISAKNPILTAVVVYGHQPSASTQNMPAAGAICTAVKQTGLGLPTILVGGHVAALPERTLKEEDADWVAGGEGLHTILDLLQALKSDRHDYSKVRGLWYRDGKAMRSNPPAPLIENLEEAMPEMAWDLLPMEKYRAHNWHCFGHPKRQPYAALYTTLGCPFHCSFCCIQAPFKSGEKVLGYQENVNTYRFWSPQSIVAQIDKLVRDYGVRNIKIADEMFVLNQKHVIGICDLLIERGYDLNIWAYARVDTIRGEGMLDKLKRAGFNWLAFGIESGSERVRYNVDKKFNQDKIFKIMEDVRAAGIHVIGNYIFGLPDEDRDCMQATLDLALELNCEFANFYSTMAYPGSALYRQAIQEGWPLPEKWSGYSQHAVDTLPLPTKYLSASEVLRFRDHAFDVYFKSPNYLEMVGQKFGQETAAHVKKMALHKLARMHA